LAKLKGIFMDIINRISARLSRDFFRWRYEVAVAKILETAPLSQGSLQFMLLSMVHQRDVLSYLAAVKSFSIYLNPIRIVVVCDPSISANDRQLLQYQIPHIELRHADEFVHPAIPRGGCWERLFAISEYNKDNYVVQLDADTLALHELTEVEIAINSKIGFVLGEEPNQQLVTFAQAAEHAQVLLKPGAHIQTRSEAALPSLGLVATGMYVRGCAGFTGFPASNDMREKLIDFSTRMTKALDTDWQRWGTEQVTSNYLVANATGTRVLPFPKYGTPDQQNHEITFLHFIGSMRFTNNKYKIATMDIISRINKYSFHY